MSRCEGCKCGRDATPDETVRGLILDACSDLAKAGIVLDAVQATLWDATSGRLAAANAGMVAILGADIDRAINQLRKISAETGL